MCGKKGSGLGEWFGRLSATVAVLVVLALTNSATAQPNRVFIPPPPPPPPPRPYIPPPPPPRPYVPPPTPNSAAQANQFQRGVLDRAQAQQQSTRLYYQQQNQQQQFQLDRQRLESQQSRRQEDRYVQQGLQRHKAIARESRDDRSPQAPLRQKRVVVQSITPRTQAAMQGVQKGDIILDYDGEPIDTVLQLAQLRGQEILGNPPRAVTLQRGDRTLIVHLRPGLIGWFVALR